MSFIDEAIYTLFNGKRTITEPIFVKDFDMNNQQLNDLIKLYQTLPPEKRKWIEKDIKLLKQGLEGEKNVYYELKNSFLPMLCLYDIRLEYDNYVAQYDFIIITKKFIYVLETKKLNGDIEITKDGDFIRIIKSDSGKIIKKEGMYSPISQNDRHVKILKEILTKEKLIKNFPIKSAVVIANSKTIVDKSKCPKNIQNSIYKYDQIVNLLKKELEDKTNDRDILEKYLYDIANFLIKNHKPITYNYASKYSLDAVDIKVLEDSKEKQKDDNNDSMPNNKNTQIYEELRKYRLETAKRENIKPYWVFTNEELNSLVEKLPKTKEELLQIKGFGQKKVEKYGDDILAILNKET
ncbi:Nuclease-related domain-containing protein [Thermoanaerobacter thermohydrosulfuricus]|jgi:hypothetical protein|uniref:Nuclease-related domain-containing protein n=1 Tax=Thermoanaerobacter thermohydrosulfuricus TaxID=1516 RepID=A0A1G7WPJ7_THETY|nr:HRDC domain-containing protein [Thermoanaerobacter thermohydrosulfuricus]SDG73804.1 Nuclease-related domain-containing protein [Thermoanaerobacter thermohydrosulfuricus]HHW57324.1 aldolase [Clostridia bacterium]